jgi:hypothetical protein
MYEQKDLSLFPAGYTPDKVTGVTATSGAPVSSVTVMIGGATVSPTGKSGHSGLSYGGEAGIGIAIALLITVPMFILFALLRRRQQQRKREQGPIMDESKFQEYSRLEVAERQVTEYYGPDGRIHPHPRAGGDATTYQEVEGDTTLRQEVEGNTTTWRPVELETTGTQPYNKVTGRNKDEIYEKLAGRDSIDADVSPVDQATTTTTSVPAAAAAAATTIEPINTTIGDLKSSNSEPQSAITPVSPPVNTLAERELHYLENEERKLRERREAILQRLGSP